jgi:hypothetical protein
VRVESSYLLSKPDEPDAVLGQMYHTLRVGMAASVTLTIGAILDGRDVLPGFTMPVQELFER